MTDPAHFLESGLREKVIEHLFVGDLLRCLWRRGSRDIEVLRAEARLAVFEFIEGWYNSRRRHSAIDYLSPLDYERSLLPPAHPSP